MKSIYVLEIETLSYGSYSKWILDISYDLGHLNSLKEQLLNARRSFIKDDNIEILSDSEFKIGDDTTVSRIVSTTSVFSYIITPFKL